MKKTLVVGTSAKSARVPHANTGNMMHAETARKLLLEFDNFPFAEWSKEEIEKAESEYSHILYVAANGIRPGASDDLPIVRSHEVLARNFSRTTLPIVTLGLGAQQPFNAEASELPSATKKLLQIVSERSKEIAVRGENTQNIISRAGIKNTTVLGCQSCFWSMKPSLDETYFRTDQSDNTIAFNYTALGAEHKAIDLAIINDAFIYGQEEHKEALAIEGDLEALRKDRRFQNYLRRSSSDESRFANWLTRKFNQFYSLEDWFADISRHRFCFGTRFHGNMVALQAGVRALWLVHDRRTEELCLHHGLPWMRMGEIDENTTIEELEERTDYTNFFRKYPANYKKLYDYLETSGLPHKLPSPVAI